MQNSRGIVMLLVSLIAGVGAVMLAARWIQGQNQPGGSRIAVAQVDIQLGNRITPGMVRLVDWPGDSIPSGAHTDLKELEGRVARSGLQRDEPVLESKLAPVGTRGGLSAVVDEGKRAMTVRVNDVIGVAGFALPGNYVDIMVNTEADDARKGDRERVISKIVLERILVLAVAQEASRDETKPRVVNAVTLEVTPQQAEQLDLARSVGNLSLVLRNQVDPKPSGTSGATKDSLLGKAEPSPRPIVRTASPIPVAARSSDCVEVIRGATKTIECF